MFEAIKAGARGYLFKDIDEQVLIEAVRAAHRGEALVDPHAPGCATNFAASAGLTRESLSFQTRSKFLG